jgi:signal transduction histidine kinase
MTSETLNLLGFALTVTLACFLWVLAYNVFVKNKGEYLNITLALSMLFAGSWLVSGFIEKILSNPSNAFTLWTFRWAYAAGCLALFFYFLFLLGLYLGRPPGKRTLIVLSVIAMITVAAALSPWAIQSAEYSEGNLTSSSGILFIWLSLFVICFGTASIYLAVAKWRRSNGIDRARTNIILCSLVFFIPFILLFSLALPAITGNDIYTSYSFLAGAIPIAFTSYAIIRLRLLDVRIILRRTSVFLLNLLILATPLAVLMAVISNVDLSPSMEKGIIFAASIALISITPFVWKRLERFSSRVFFSGLYDYAQLKEAAEESIYSSSDPFQSIPSTLRELIFPMGLERLGVLILPQVIGEHGMLFECWRGEDDSLQIRVDEEYITPDWFFRIEASTITEEVQRWPKNTWEKDLGEKLGAREISACIPIKTSTKSMGHFLCGLKTSRRALSVTDIKCLEDTGEHLAFYIDNYALSSELNVRVKELEKVYKDLRMADEFKAEIIQVMAHELRTPATIISGFAQVLVDNWDRLTEEDKLSAFNSIYRACLRFNNLSGQFTLLTDYQRGEVETRFMLIKIRQLIEDTCDAFDPENSKRVDNRLGSEDFIFSDPEYLSNILRNIISNALRFSPLDDPVLVYGQEEEGSYCLYIQDFGKGIPLEEGDKIFEPFVRLENVLHHTQGTGLGLYIVRILSSMLGIQIYADSSAGKGTTFKLVIPMRDLASSL